MVRKALFVLPFWIGRENYTVVLWTAVSVPVLLSLSRLTTCARTSVRQAEVGWEQPWLGADGHPVAPQGQWLMA